MRAVLRTRDGRSQTAKPTIREKTNSVVARTPQRNSWSPSAPALVREKDRAQRERWLTFFDNSAANSFLSLYLSTR